MRHTSHYAQDESAIQQDGEDITLHHIKGTTEYATVYMDRIGTSFQNW
jgi:hypothetical protein